VAADITSVVAIVIAIKDPLAVTIASVTLIAAAATTTTSPRINFS